MIAELFAVYMETLTAFYRGIFGGGLFQLLVIGFMVWWLFCRRRGCSCRHCGCWCGHCRCDEVRMNAHEEHEHRKAGSGSQD